MPLEGRGVETGGLGYKNMHYTLYVLLLYEYTIKTQNERRGSEKRNEKALHLCADYALKLSVPEGRALREAD